MIVYKIDIMEALKNIGYSSYKLRQEKIFGEATMTKFRKKEHFNFDNLNILCELLQCQPGDILEYAPDGEIKKEDTQKEVPQEITVREMKKVAQKNTPIKLKRVGNKNQNIL